MSLWAKTIPGDGLNSELLAIASWIWKLIALMLEWEAWYLKQPLSLPLMSLGCINLHNKFTHLWTAQRYWMVSFSEDIYITYGAMGYSLPVYLISKYSWYTFSSHFNTQFQIAFYACPVGCEKYELCLPRMFHWVLSLSTHCKQGSCLTTCSCYTFDSISGFPLRPCSLCTFKWLSEAGVLELKEGSPSSSHQTESFGSPTVVWGPSCTIFFPYPFFSNVSDLY